MLFVLLALTFQKYINITVGFTLLLSMSFACVGTIYFRMKRIEERIAFEEAAYSSKTIKLTIPGQREERPVRIQESNASR